MNMKISGSKGKGRHLGKNVNLSEHKKQGVMPGEFTDVIPKKKMSTRGVAVLTLSIIFSVLLTVGGGLYIYFYLDNSLNTAPSIRVDPKGQEFLPPADIRGYSGPYASTNAPREFVRDTQTLKYTFLILATDGGANTDVIMVATFDATNYTLEIVNIPRDTLVNVSWNSIKKANSIYANMRAKHGWDNDSIPAAMDATVEVFADVLGFQVDYWFLVDMKAFVALVNAVDSVEFYIPQRMDYDDPAQGLSIHFSEGLQRLNGQQALEVVRFRRYNYGAPDIVRIGTQQEFLTAAAQQILAKSSSIDIAEFASIIINYVKTDIDLNNLLWFGKEFLKLDSEKINFHIMPANYWDSVGGDSYVTIYLDLWLELLNEKISPFLQDFTSTDVSILTRDSNGYLYATDGNRQGSSTWGAGQGARPDPDNQGSNNPPNSTPVPPSTPTQEIPTETVPTETVPTETEPMETEPPETEPPETEPPETEPPETEPPETQPPETEPPSPPPEDDTSPEE